MTDMKNVMAAALLIGAGSAALVVAAYAEPLEQAGIPDWVKNMAGWWAEGLVSDAEYAGSLSYLVAEGLIEQPPEPEPTCDELLGEMTLYGFAASSVMLPIIDNPDRKKVFKPLHDEYLETFRELKNTIDDAECHMTPKESIIYDGINKAYNVVKNVYDDNLTTDRASCVLFCDSTGYEPQWAKNMGKWQAHSKCMTLIGVEDPGTRDFNWCDEYFGYMLDNVG